MCLHGADGDGNRPLAHRVRTILSHGIPVPVFMPQSYRRPPRRQMDMRPYFHGFSYDLENAGARRVFSRFRMISPDIAASGLKIPVIISNFAAD